MALIITDPTNLISGGDAGTAFAAPLSLDTSARTLTITPGSGILPALADGVTGQAFYSALKLLWKNNSTYIKFPFPIEMITPEQFEFINGWAPANDVTRKALRTCGWVERNSSGVITKTYSGIVSLGSLGSTDTPYYQQDSATGAPVNFAFLGPVNEAIAVKIIATIPSATGVANATETFTFNNHGFVNGDKVVYTTAGTPPTGLTSGNTYYIKGVTANTFQIEPSIGSGTTTFTTDGVGNQVFTKDSTAYCKLFAREYQKTYSAANLADIGVTTMTYIVYRFPLANAGDSLKVTAQGTGGDYDKILITYLRDPDNAYSTYNVRGTYNTGSIPYALSDVVQSANGRWYECKLAYTSNATQPSANATNWEAYQGEKTFDGSTYYPYTVVIDADNTVSAGTSGVNTAIKIYERIQYELRQTYDIDDNANGLVTGKTADSLLRFVGDTLVTSNGVFIESINSNDTNSIEFYDALGVKRQYPFTAAGTLTFNTNLQADASAIYRVFYDKLQGTANKYGQTGAVLVKNASSVDISGTVSAQPTLSWTFAYDGNTQTETQWQAATTYVAGDEYKNGSTWYRVTTGYTSGGTFGATDTTNSAALNGTSDGPSVVVVALGLATGQYVSSTAKLLRATGQNIGLVSSIERNYSNPA